MQDIDQSAEEKVSKYRWVILAAMWATYMSSCVARLAIPALSTFFDEELKVAEWQVGLLMSASQISSLIIKIPSGFIIDAIGVRPIIIIGKVIAGVFIALTFFASSFNMMMLYMMLAGIGGGLVGSVSYKAILCFLRGNVPPLWASRQRRSI